MSFEEQLVQGLCGYKPAAEVRIAFEMMSCLSGHFGSYAGFADGARELFARLRYHCLPTLTAVWVF